MSDNDPMPETRTPFEAWTARRLAVMQSDVSWIKRSMESQSAQTYILAGLLVTVVLSLVRSVL